jgi:epsilon-lactone hydrolase
LLPSYFAQAQKSTPKNITYQGMPTTISEEAQEELRKITFNPAILKAPDPSDLNGWKKQYNNSESMFAELSQPIIDLYQPNISETKLGGLQFLILNPETGMIVEKC